MRLIPSICLLFLAVATPMGVMRRASAQAPAQTSALEPLKIVTSAGPQSFSVEVMKTDEERARGLMYRRFLPADRGMLFDFKTVQPVMMWMKNTYIPLDMIFISRDGIVTHVAENAEPMSERIISSQGPAYAVLEVNAGTAARLKIRKGDRVEQALFRK